MKLVLTHGYFLREDPKEGQIMRPYPPLGILYISAFLKQHGIDCQVLDSTFTSFEAWCDYIRKEKPNVVAFYTNLMTKVNIIKSIQWIRSVAELEDVKIIQGGPDVTHNLQDYLSVGTDYIVIGEGEETMLELTQFLAERREAPSEVPGIAYLFEGKVVKTPPRTKIREIDQLPFPDRAAIDLEQYLDTWKQHHGMSTLSISTQRGCPYTCRWCSTAVYGQSYRRRSPALVVEELKYLVKTYKPDAFWFVDDVFTVSHKWLRSFVEELENRKLNIRFECITRADRMNEEAISLLRKAGCFRVWIGAESGSQKVIDAMDRRVDVDHVRDMIIRARESGLQAGTFIMLGYPGETQADIEETVHHLKTSAPDQFTITIAYPIKGTGLFEQVESIQTRTPEWTTSTDRDRDFKRTYNRRYYDHAVRWVVNEVHFHKKKLTGEHLSLSGFSYLLKARVAKAAMWMERKRSKTT